MVIIGGLKPIWHQIICNHQHYSGVMMGAMASQMTSLMIIYSTVYSGADQTSKPYITNWPLCGEFPEFPAQMACSAEKVFS